MSKISTLRTIITLIVFLVVSVVPALGHQAGAVAQGTGGAAGPQAGQPPEPSGIERLMADTGGGARVSLNPATGVAGFVRLPQGLKMSTSFFSPTSATGEADVFFTQYGGVFGVTQPAAELDYMGRQVDGMGNTHVAYQQLYQGVPVFAGVLKVHLNEQNAITAVNGTFVPKISVSSSPGLTADEAAQIATSTVAGQNDLRGPNDLSAVNSKLFVFRTGLVEGVVGADHLVYEVEVANTAVTVREFVYVDAHTGEVVDQYTGIHVVKDRQTYDANFDSAAGPASVLCRGEGDPPSGDLACDEAHDYAGDTYDYFFNAFGRDSLDDAGMSLISYVNVCPGGVCPWYNASWNGQFMSYGTTPTGRPWTGDDTVAHEFGHGITDFTSNLIYQWQPGAISEAMSDIYGEVVDALNGAGLDSPDLPRIDYPINSTDVFPAGACIAPFGQSDTYPYTNVRWLQGEQDYLIRDMWAPSCMGDPDHVTHPNYHCAATDYGGVHINSGVVNHHFALLVDGGTFNGQTITGMGFIKAGAIYYQAQTNYLTPASNFADLDNALSASCTDLIGATLNDPVTGAPSAEVISEADCVEVDQASLAVEFSVDPSAQCGFEPMLDPNAPPLCEGLGSVEIIATEDWEGGALPAGWTVGTHDVANPLTFDTPDWDVVGNLPGGANGTYAAFVPDLIIGNCADDDESGALFLDSPPITVPAGVIPRVAIDHWVATEVGWDGGNVKASVNGGPWTLISPNRFEFNGYNSSLNPTGAGNTNPLAGEAAFTGTDAGSVSGSWGQSQVNLIGLATGGDSVQFRFDFGIDGCNGVVGWYVDDVQVYSCSDEEPPICGDGLLDLGESCDDGNAADGDGCSSICQVEPGWICEDPAPPTPGTNVIDDGSFEAGPFGGTWSEFSSNFGTPICSVGLCGTGTGTGPSDGAFWAWFGGIPAYEEGAVSQAVTIPSTATDLTFDLEQIICDSNADYMEMTVDGNQEFFSDGSSSLCGTLGYTEQTVDMSAYADDGTHTLEFHSEIFANNGDVSNFFLDNVFLSDNVPVVSTPSVCTQIVEDLACNAGAIGFHEGIPSTWMVIDNAGTGMVWSNIAGAGEAGNYTGGDGDAATASSDVFGPADFDTELRSNMFSLADATSASLDYLANYQNYASFDLLDLDISSDSGATWTTLLSWNEDHGGFRNTPGEAVSIDLSAYLGMSDLQLRWRYYDPTTFDWDWYAQVDDVSLICNLAPDCSAAAPSIYSLWPPNHKFVAVDILGVTDPDGDPLSITIDSIYQDEPVLSRGSGNTSPDGQGIGTPTAEVRAELDSRGNGRVYHIGFTADDGRGGMCSGEVLVGVPHDQGVKGDPVDDGALYDSTMP